MPKHIASTFELHMYLLFTPLILLDLELFKLVNFTYPIHRALIAEKAQTNYAKIMQKLCKNYVKYEDLFTLFIRLFRIELTLSHVYLV